MGRFTKSWCFGSKTSNGYYTLVSLTVKPQEGKVEEEWEFIDYPGGVFDPPADSAASSVTPASKPKKKGGKDAAAEPKSKGKTEKQKPKTKKVKAKTEKKPSPKAKTEKKGKS